MAVPEDDSSIASGVAFTGKITAAFRSLEQEKNPEAPIIVDHLARMLAGDKAMAVVQKDYAEMEAAQGPGKSLRVPARTRILDDALLHALSDNALEGAHVQVVCLGTGFDTRPWRLDFPVPVAWYDVDQPVVIQEKLRSLAAAGAAAAAKAAAAAATTEAALFPLKASSYVGVPADLSQVKLADALAGTGFDPSTPTIWIAEALIYYIPLPGASELLLATSQLSATGSRLLATCIDKELLVVDQQMQEGSHYFAQMWHFCIDDLLADGLLARLGWSLAVKPDTTKALALATYGKETYVAPYGGAELFFSCNLLPVAP